MELQHHGVKGQKWGVRRYQYTDGSLTPAGRKRYQQEPQTYDNDDNDKHSEQSTIFTKRNIAIGAAVVGVSLAVLGGVYMYKKENAPIHLSTFKGDKIDASKLSTHGLTIPKGTKFQRISSKSIEDYAKDGKLIYASYLKKDNRLYKSEMPEFIRQWGREGVISDDGKKAYAHVLKTAHDIKVPSERTTFELFKKATGRTEASDASYKHFMNSLRDKDNPEVQRFLDLVRKSGYNALIDLNDAEQYAKSPLMLLNPNSDIASSKSHRITALEKVIAVILR